MQMSTLQRLQRLKLYRPSGGNLAQQLLVLQHLTSLRGLQLQGGILHYSRSYDLGVFKAMSDAVLKVSRLHRAGDHEMMPESADVGRFNFGKQTLCNDVRFLRPLDAMLSSDAPPSRI